MNTKQQNEHEYFKIFILTFAYGVGLWVGFMSEKPIALLGSLLIFAVIQVLCAIIVKATRKPSVEELKEQARKQALERQAVERFCLNCSKQLELEGDNAKKFCCDRCRYSHKNKINPSHTFKTYRGELRKTWNKAEINELIRLFNNKLKVREIAKKISRSPNSVKEKIKYLRYRGRLGELAYKYQKVIRIK